MLVEIFDEVLDQLDEGIEEVIEEVVDELEEVFNRTTVLEFVSGVEMNL